MYQWLCRLITTATTTLLMQNSTLAHKTQMKKTMFRSHWLTR